MDEGRFDREIYIYKKISRRKVSAPRLEWFQVLVIEAASQCRMAHPFKAWKWMCPGR